MSDAKPFLPAAGYDWALPFYDVMTRLAGIDRMRRGLVAHAAIGPGQRILDVGCGTGTLAVLIKRLHPEVEIVGVDPDPKVLARSKRKAARAGVAVTFDEGSAQKLPYADASFDVVFSSFMFHHLPGEDKAAALREVRRVLRPHGTLHLIDFGSAGSTPHGLRAWLLRRHGHTRENFGDRISSLLHTAGFDDVRVVRETYVPAGPVVHYRAA